MEDLLRAYARKRREEAGAPFELSPDVRARLQEEVRRGLGKPAAAPPPRWGLSLTGWLRLALGGAAAALVMFCLLGAPIKAKNKQFAKADKQTAPVALAHASPMPAPVQPAAAPATPPPALAKAAPLAEAAKAPAAATAVVAPATNDLLAMERARSSDEAGAKAVQPKETPKPAAASGLAADRTDGNAAGAMAGVPARGGGGFGGFGGGGGGGGAGGGGAGMAAATPGAQLASIPPSAAGSLGVAGQVESSPATRSVRRSLSEGGNSQSSSTFAQHMARLEPPLGQNAPVNNEKKIEAPSAGVLALFQIERTGEQVRIVDADGSAYEGRVVTPEMLDKLQAADLMERRAAKDAGNPPGAANAAQQNAYSGNFAGQRTGYADAQANASELPPKTAIYDNAAQNQVSSAGTDLLKSAGPQQAGEAGGFAFQVSGLNRKFNQPVTIVGSCINVALQPGASPVGGNLSNQFQTLAGVNTALNNAMTPPGRAPASQSQNILDSNIANFKNNAQNAQNAAPAGQFWRVSGQVQIGPSNRFNLDAATVPQ